MEGTANLISAELEVDATAQMYLKETARWGKFLAILGFVMSGILALIALFAGALFSRLTSGIPGGGDMVMMGTTFITIIYLAVAVVNFFMALYLYKFSTKMKSALLSNDQAELNDTFLNLRSMFRLIGILTAIYLGFLVLVILASIVGAMFAR